MCFRFLSGDDQICYYITCFIQEAHGYTLHLWPGMSSRYTENTTLLPQMELPPQLFMGTRRLGVPEIKHRGGKRLAKSEMLDSCSLLLFLCGEQK